MVCRNPYRESPDFNKWLAVLEAGDKGWYLPAGGVDYGEQFDQAGIRECIEEAGMQVTIKGILNVDYMSKVQGDRAFMRMIYYAEPLSLEAANSPKSHSDKES